MQPELWRRDERFRQLYQSPYWVAPFKSLRHKLRVQCTGTGSNTLVFELPHQVKATIGALVNDSVKFEVN
jgi:hypothetical protein